MSSRTRRRTTVHDLASLRLHPDGSRVQNSQSLSHDGTPGVSSQTNLRASKYIAQDARGNWIARDAGGADFVKRKYGKQDKGKGRATNLDIGEDDGVVSDGDEVKDSRAIKRRKFLHDYSFLGSSSIEDGIPSSSFGEPSSSTLDPSQSNEPCSLPVPSSDLLKCVHYFASEYYAAHGQLSDLAKEARKEAKLIKQQQLDDILNERDDENEEQDSTLREDGVEDDEQVEEGMDNQPKPKRRGGRKAGKKWGEARLRRDMYKAFDGSALMAIGMLLQEHVAEVMHATPPEGWEEQMEEEEAQESRERRVKGGRRRRKKERRVRERVGEGRDEDGGVVAEEQRDSEESSDSEGSSSSSTEISSTESDDDSDSGSST
ncbi:hypothetical protein SCHPADRAFT_850845 [Schizopora paradoxa]|uniref:Uncharacterized protein n=1 Tax=Schizopora paradoxa TaxID=27342 RepID=A0A0H2RYG2_9AGAM|nr:hypothetical protein SCHPADRAFT_850845 [Schizopora paradoxa]